MWGEKMKCQICRRKKEIVDHLLCDVCQEAIDRLHRIHTQDAVPLAEHIRTNAGHSVRRVDSKVRVITAKIGDMND